MTPLARLAARAAADPHFLAHPLAAYARRHGLDDAQLAARLGVPPAALPHLRLCPAPRPGEGAAGYAARFRARWPGLAAGPLGEAVAGRAA